MRATSASSAGRPSASGSGQSARCTDELPVNPLWISSATMGRNGAATRVRVVSTTYSVSKAARSVSAPPAFQNRSRERRMYQLLRASMKAAISAAPPGRS